MSDKEIEQEIRAKGKTAPRVTPDHIESVISSEHFSPLLKDTINLPLIISMMTRTHWQRRTHYTC